MLSKLEKIFHEEKELSLSVRNRVCFIYILEHILRLMNNDTLINDETIRMFLINNGMQQFITKRDMVNSDIHMTYNQQILSSMNESVADVLTAIKYYMFNNGVTETIDRVCFNRINELSAQRVQIDKLKRDIDDIYEYTKTCFIYTVQDKYNRDYDSNKKVLDVPFETICFNDLNRIMTLCFDLNDRNVVGVINQSSKLNYSTQIKFMLSLLYSIRVNNRSWDNDEFLLLYNGAEQPGLDQFNKAVYKYHTYWEWQAQPSAMIKQLSGISVQNAFMVNILNTDMYKHYIVKNNKCDENKHGVKLVYMIYAFIRQIMRDCPKPERLVIGNETSVGKVADSEGDVARSY